VEHQKILTPLVDNNTLRKNISCNNKIIYSVDPNSLFTCNQVENFLLEIFIFLLFINYYLAVLENIYCENIFIFKIIRFLNLRK
jgi:hypothetical protein